MNDRVQALAGSIYEEFEQVRNKTVIYRTVPGTDYSDQKKKRIHGLSVAVRLPGTSIRRMFMLAN
jgi:hypothetical protein